MADHANSTTAPEADDDEVPALLERWRNLGETIRAGYDGPDGGEHHTAWLRLVAERAELEREVVDKRGFEQLAEVEVGLEMLQEAFVEGERPAGLDKRLCDELLACVRHLVKRDADDRGRYVERVPVADAFTRMCSMLNLLDIALDDAFYNRGHIKVRPGERTEQGTVFVQCDWKQWDAPQAAMHRLDEDVAALRDLLQRPGA